MSRPQSHQNGQKSTFEGRKRTLSPLRGPRWRMGSWRPRESKTKNLRTNRTDRGTTGRFQGGLRVEAMARVFLPHDLVFLLLLLPLAQHDVLDDPALLFGEVRQVGQIEAHGRPRVGHSLGHRPGRALRRPPSGLRVRLHPGRAAFSGAHSRTRPFMPYALNNCLLTCSQSAAEPMTSSTPIDRPRRWRRRPGRGARVPPPPPSPAPSAPVAALLRARKNFRATTTRQN